MSPFAKRMESNKMTHHTSALAVANYLLDLGEYDRIKITPLKLQKLLYFCYAWYAGNTGEELFPEDIEAWQYGPVIPEVYREFRECGRDPIRIRATTLDLTTDNQVRAIEATLQDENLKSDIKSVWDAYKTKSEGWLVTVSHMPEEPWGILENQYGGGTKRKIPFNLIRSIYQAKVQNISEPEATSA